MSYLHFHSLHGEARVKGRERSRLAVFGNRSGISTIEPLSDSCAERLHCLIRPGSYRAHGLAASPAWRRDLLESMALSPSGIVFQWRHTPFRADNLVANSALHHGDDQAKLAIRLDRQCEIHTWVDGPNRAWLAQIIQAGVERGVYQRESGWTAVLELLRDRDDEPVVTSCSLTGIWFPNADIADYAPAMPAHWVPASHTPTSFAAEHRDTARARAEYWAEETWSRFEELPEHEQWCLAMAGLRAAEPTHWLELTPARWGREFYFRHGLTLQDLLAEDYAERLDTALAAYDSSLEGSGR